MRRRQLPARSPFRISDLPAAARAALLGPEDPRSTLGSRLLAEYGAAGVALTASATHALTLALKHASRTRPHAAILLPAYTCFEVATAAVATGAPVLLYDLDPASLGPDWNAIARTASGRDVAAIVVSPLFGVPVDWESASRVAREAHALLVADVAQAYGSRWRGRPAGAAGDLIVTSFGRGKGWTGFGGGALLWTHTLDANPEGDEPLPLATTSAEARTLVTAGAQWILGRPSLFGVPAAIPALHIGETVYHAPTPVRAMTRASAALVLTSAPAAAAEVDARRLNALEYVGALPAGLLPAWSDAAAGPDSGALRFPLTVRGGWATLRQTAAPWHGAAPGYPTSLAQVAALRPLLEPARPTPVADELASSLVTLPTHSGTTARDRSRLVDLLRGLAPSHSSHAPVM